MLKKIALLHIILTCFNSAQSMDCFSNQIPIAPALPVYPPYYFPQGSLLPMYNGQQQVLTHQTPMYNEQPFNSYNSSYVHPPYSMQTVNPYMSPVQSFTYANYYEGQWQESFHNLQCYYDPSLNVKSIDFGVDQTKASPEESMRLNIAYGAYRKTIEISEQMQDLERNMPQGNYIAQLKGIAFQLLRLTQIEKSLWNEYVRYNGNLINTPILGNEWVNAIHSQQNLLTNELGQFKHSKGKKKGQYYRKIKEIWEQYKEKSRTLEKLNNDAISHIMLQIEQFPILCNDPLIKHELTYRKKYQIYKSWMTSAEGRVLTPSKR
jgi:hypothetical protein